VIFGLTYDHIYGESPPYYGNSSKNTDISWYYVLADQGEGFKSMQVMEKEILVLTTCGRLLYFNENGVSNKIARSDQYSCQKPLQLVELMIKNKD
jgi:hypothetical protein